MLEEKTTKSEVAIDEEMVWIENAKQDPLAFEPIYNRYFLDIYRFCLTRVADKALAGEITSNVFTKALTKLNSYKQQGYLIKSWLYRIAYNEVMEHFRTEQKEQAVNVSIDGINNLFNEETDPDLAEEKEAQMDQILSALRSLETADLSLIELRFFEQRSYKEIAEILHLKEGNVRVQTHRVIQRIKKLINNG